MDNNFASNRLADLYWAKEHGELLDHLGRMIQNLANPNREVDDQAYLTKINEALPHFFYFFLMHDLKLNQRRQVEGFIHLNNTLALLTHFSVFSTTDIFIKILLQQSNSSSRLAKILTLYSPYNTIKLDYRKIFSALPSLANEWYVRYLNRADFSLANKNCLQNLCYHYAFDPEKYFHPTRDLQVYYFLPTYCDNRLDAIVRSRVNKKLQGTATALRGRSQGYDDKKPRIAVFSSHWQENHSIYKTQAGFIRSLVGDYHLTLIYPDSNSGKQETSHFDAVIVCPHTGNNTPLTEDFIASLRGRFSLIYYPAVGLDPWSIQLANQDIVPMQATSVGHPVSTYGSRINLYFTGAEVEEKNQLAEHYSEHVVLLPGYGLVYEPITYRLRLPVKDPDSVTLCCSWHQQKINYPMLKLLRKIADRSQRRIKFRFLVTTKKGHLSLKALRNTIEELLSPEAVEIMTHLPHSQYMHAVEECDICLESHPFGSSNVMTEYLYLGKPTVAYAGAHFYNRIGSAMLRRVGLEELIAENEADYIRLTLRLIEDLAYRQDIEARVTAIDKTKIIADYSSGGFKVAIDYLLAHVAVFSLDQPQRLIQFDRNNGIESRLL